MSDPIRFVPHSTLDANANLREFVKVMRTLPAPLGLDCNRFEEHAWSVAGLTGKGMNRKFIYFAQLGFDPIKKSRRKGVPTIVPDSLLLREPFLSFAKALTTYLHGVNRTTGIPSRIIAFRHLEAALHETNGSTCPTGTTPEVLNRAKNVAIDRFGANYAYTIAQELGIIYRFMVKLGLVAVSSEWSHSVRHPPHNRTRVGDQFNQERCEKLPSPLALEALAEIFNSDTDEPAAVLAASLCALMLCSPDRSVEVLYAPLDVLAPNWVDPDTGEVGTALRWFPAKGAAPLLKTVIPSMRDIAVRAVDKMRRLSEPARKLAFWYETHSDKIYLPSHLEFLRSQNRLNTAEIHSILFGDNADKITKLQTARVVNWLAAHHVSLQSGRGIVTTVAFADLERGVLATLPEDFPIMDPVTGMRYSEALCIARHSEFMSYANCPSACSFDRINYSNLAKALKSNKHAKSIFEKLGYRDADGQFLSLTTHMLRHYLNTLVRQSGALTEDEIAKWSGRKSAKQNATYNHESDRDMLAKLRNAVGDPSLSVGPFANIDNRVFVRRDEFASIKIITAHTSEFGHCIHDYAQAPCQVHADCINCNEQVCVKGDRRAEENLRKMQVETTLLQEKARAAFSAEVLGAAEWFKHQTNTLERINQLIAILDDPNVPQGSVIQLSGVVPPSRLAMAEDERRRGSKSVSRTVASLDDVRVPLLDANHTTKEHPDAG